MPHPITPASRRHRLHPSSLRNPIPGSHSYMYFPAGSPRPATHLHHRGLVSLHGAMVPSPHAHHPKYLPGRRSCPAASRAAMVAAALHLTQQAGPAPAKQPRCPRTVCVCDGLIGRPK